MLTRFVLAALVVILAGGALYFGFRHLSDRARPGWHRELVRFVRERPRGARVYVAVPAQVSRWREVRALAKDELIVGVGEAVPLNVATAFVVTYASGEILATSVPPPRDLPAGAYFARPVREPVSDTLTQAEVAEASGCVNISFGPARDSASRRRVYETKVTNQCSHPVRVTHFGAYSLLDGVWKLNTIVDGFFTADQFREWYGAPEDGWLPAGTSAMDKENYGPNALWVFFFETRDGQRGRAVGRAPS
jgi:hypothetical protein